MIQFTKLDCGEVAAVRVLESVVGVTVVAHQRTRRHHRTAGTPAAVIASFANVHAAVWLHQILI